MVCNGDDAEEGFVSKTLGWAPRPERLLLQAGGRLCAKLFGTDVANEAAEAADNTPKGENIMRDTWT
jgi:hypothetical protein